MSFRWTCGRPGCGAVFEGDASAHCPHWRCHCRESQVTAKLAAAEKKIAELEASLAAAASPAPDARSCSVCMVSPAPARGHLLLLRRALTVRLLHLDDGAHMKAIDAIDEVLKLIDAEVRRAEQSVFDTLLTQDYPEFRSAGVVPHFAHCDCRVCVIKPREPAETFYAPRSATVAMESGVGIRRIWPDPIPIDYTTWLDEEDLL